MIKNLFYLIAIGIIGCSSQKIEVDEIVFATKIYSCDSTFKIGEAMAISNHRIVAFGTREDIENIYSSQTITTYEGIIYPGFIDAHSHFYGYGTTLNTVDLKNTFSLEEVVNKTVEFAKNSSTYWITGRGWDQTDWTTQGNISNNLLNIYFPNQPVFLKRVDGHAGLANNKALELAGITPTTKVQGGIIEQKNGILTGLLKSISVLFQSMVAGEAAAVPTFKFNLALPVGAIISKLASVPEPITSKSPPPTTVV